MKKLTVSVLVVVMSSSFVCVDAQQARRDTAKTKDIQEVVLLGFGQKKTVKELTGSVSTVRGEKLDDLPVASIDKALMGNVSGVQAGASSGQPGGFVDIRVRGITSVNGGVNPIFIIDGVRVSSGDLSDANVSTTTNILSSLNPDDIESMTVLKDAVSTSLYGADAGAGVVIITTKSGRAGKPRFDLSQNIGVNEVAFKQPGTLTKEQWTNLTAVGMYNYTPWGFGSIADARDAIFNPDIDWWGYAPFANENTDWNQELKRQSAYQASTNFSVSGGTDRLKYFGSANYFTQESVYRASDFKKLTASTKIDYKATDRLNISTDFQFANSVTNSLPNGGAFANPLIAQYMNLPIDPVRNADGTYYYGINNALPSGNANVAALQQLNNYTTNTSRVFANLAVDYKIANNLNYRFVFAPEFITLNNDRYWSPLHGDGYGTHGDMYSTARRLFNFNVQNILSYDFKLDDDNKFVARLIQEAYKSNSKLVGGEAQVVGTTTLHTLNSFVKPVSAIGANYTNSRFGYAAQLGYSFRNIFNLDLAYRRDNLSNFEEGKKGGDFYSVGAGLDLAALIIPKNDYLNSFKVRSSYGKLGNQIYSSPYALYGYGMNYGNNAGATYTAVYDAAGDRSGIHNPSLTWETVKPFNVGIDFSILKNMLSFSAEYYNKKTENLVFPAPLSAAQGLTSYDTNIGSLVNKGFEFSMNANVIKAKERHDFYFSADANLSTLENKMLTMAGNKDIIGNANTSQQILRVGEGVDSWYMRKWAGVDPSNGDPLWYINGKDGATTNNYNLAQRAIQGRPFAKLFGGVGLKAGYAGFDISAQAVYSYGAKTFDNWAYYTESDGQFTPFVPGYASQANYWSTDNPNSPNPKPIYGGNKLSNRPSTRFLHSADFWRISNVRVAYTFDKQFLGDAPLNKLTVYAMGNNIWTHALDKNLTADPSAAVAGTGLTDLNLPPLKSYLIGFNLEF